MYLNEQFFLPMVQKARQEDCFDLLLAGREEWRIIERDMLGDFPDRPTDWGGYIVLEFMKYMKRETVE